MSAADFEPDAARCRLFARRSDPSFSFQASGSPKFVAASTGAAILGAAIGTAVAENANFNDCMEARGWRVADGAAPAAAVAPAAQAAAAAPVQTVQMAAAAPTATSVAPIPAPSPRRNLGIKSIAVTDWRAYAAQLDPPRGVVVVSVMQGGAAAAAGLQAGDVILSLGAAPLMTIADLQQALAATPPNSVVTAEIWRDRQEVTADLRF